MLGIVLYFRQLAFKLVYSRETWGSHSFIFLPDPTYRHTHRL